jgi:ABC-type uncharacterized transport system substrate-binding protein
MKKWRLGYLQGGDYLDYKLTLIATIEGLIELGWISPFDINKISGLNTIEIWNWLAKENLSDYISFVSDAFYDAEWKTDHRLKVAENLAKRIHHKGDIDLVIAMGTWAGQDLSKRPLKTNVLVMTASDPVASGIINSPTHSGNKNLHAHIDPTFFERQIRFFHDAIKFKKLGIIYEDSLAGRSYGGIESAKRLTNELGFEIVTCFAVSDIPDAQKREEAYLNCLDSIASDIDALYVTVHGGVSETSLPMITAQSMRHGIPTFSQAGSAEVELGLLMSLSRINFRKVGLFQAAIIANVFNGAKPGELVQVFEEPLHISFNISTAVQIGFVPSADFIAAADILYHKNSIQD